MKADRPDYHDSLRALMRQAYKAKDAAKAIYYSNALARSCACASWETFKGAWAFDGWLKANASAIATLQAEWKRFAYLSP